MLNLSPLTKWRSLECISSEFQDKNQQSMDAGDECEIVFIVNVIEFEYIFISPKNS